MGCFVVAEFQLTSALRGPSAIAEPLVIIQHVGQLPSGKYKKNMISKVICTYFSSILVCWCIIVHANLSAIKCAVTDNKTANINDKNCSLSIVLTAMDQKVQKS